MTVPSKILIAYDDASIRLVLSQAFSRLGYQVRATSNASTLLKWVSDGEGDLVITDVVMPDENVFDVLPRIRKQRPRLPVIVMSAQNTLLTAVNAAEIGAYEYVPKPFDLDDMTAAAKRALARPADTEVARAQARAVAASVAPWQRSAGGFAALDPSHPATPATRRPQPPGALLGARSARPQPPDARPRPLCARPRSPGVSFSSRETGFRIPCSPARRAFRGSCSASPEQVYAAAGRCRRAGAAARR